MRSQTTLGQDTFLSKNHQIGQSRLGIQVFIEASSLRMSHLEIAYGYEWKADPHKCCFDLRNPYLESDRGLSLFFNEEEGPILNSRYFDAACEDGRGVCDRNLSV